MKKCPYCTGEDQDNAVVCKWCRRVFPETSSAAVVQAVSQQPVVKAQEANKGSTTIMIVTFIVIILSCVIIAVVTLQNRDHSSSGATDMEIDAYYTCKEFITKGLKAPSTAEFQKYYEITVKDYGSETFGMRLYVDAENSFGAMIRGTYDCKVRHGSEDNWFLMALDPVE